MLLRKKLIACLQKLIYGWLIFCVGGVGSLTYYDGFLPGHEHGEHPYHLSILGETHRHLPPPRPEVGAEQMHLSLARSLNSQADSILAIHLLAPGFSRFFSSGLSDGYLLTSTHRTILDLPRLFTSLPAAALLGQSAWLAPPDKPPSVYQGEFPRYLNSQTVKNMQL